MPNRLCVLNEDLLYYIASFLRPEDIYSLEIIIYPIKFSHKKINKLLCDFPEIDLKDIKWCPSAYILFCREYRELNIHNNLSDISKQSGKMWAKHLGKLWETCPEHIKERHRKESDRLKKINRPEIKRDNKNIPEITNITLYPIGGWRMLYINDCIRVGDHCLYKCYGEGAKIYKGIVQSIMIRQPKTGTYIIYKVKDIDSNEIRNIKYDGNYSSNLIRRLRCFNTKITIDSGWEQQCPFCQASCGTGIYDINDMNKILDFIDKLEDPNEYIFIYDRKNECGYTSCDRISIGKDTSGIYLIIEKKCKYSITSISEYRIIISLHQFLSKYKSKWWYSQHSDKNLTELKTMCKEHKLPRSGNLWILQERLMTIDENYIKATKIIEKIELKSDSLHSLDEYCNVSFQYKESIQIAY